MKLLILFIISLNLQALAAPFPVTSSSILTDPSFGLFFTPHGFSIKSSGTDWTLNPESNKSIFQSYKYKPKENSFSKIAELTIRIDQISNHQTLELYAKKWMREYPQFGFEILGTKTLKMGGGNALLVDLYQRGKNQQLRQLILQKNSKVVIMTCSDQLDNFKKTLTQCNQLMNSFNWQ